MTIKQFGEKADLANKSELNKVKYLAYYYKAKSMQDEFTVEDIRKWFVVDLNHSVPNLYRLRSNLTKSRDFVKGVGKESYKINSRVLAILEKEFDLGNGNDEEVVTLNSILPESLYNGTRGFIVSLAKQINASYENNIFDGCA